MDDGRVVESPVVIEGNPVKISPNWPPAGAGSGEVLTTAILLYT